MNATEQLAYEVRRLAAIMMRRGTSDSGELVAKLQRAFHLRPIDVDIALAVLAGEVDDDFQALVYQGRSYSAFTLPWSGRDSHRWHAPRCPAALPCLSRSRPELVIERDAAVSAFTSPRFRRSRSRELRNAIPLAWGYEPIALALLAVPALSYFFPD